MATAVFYDPERKRWKQLRAVFDVAGVLLTLLVVFFFYTLFKEEKLVSLVLPEPKRPYHALKEKERRKLPARKVAHRKSKAAPSQVALNSDEGIRAAFYVQWDAGSFASLREYFPQIDLLFPEWLHVLSADGRLEGVDAKNKLFPVFSGGVVRPVDDKVMPFLKAENADLEVFPLVNNFDPVRDVWMTEVAGMFNSPAKRAIFRAELVAFLATDRYRGLTVDFEGFPFSAQPGYRSLLAELSSDLHARGMKLYVALPAHNEDFDYAYVAGHADGVILMAYDQHYPGGPAGPVAAQNWFTDNLNSALKAMPRGKIIVAVGNYGYEWASDPKHPGRDANAKTVPVQEAWLTARESEASPELDPDSLNPHYAYVGESGLRHDVWFLDAVTALNQMRAAQGLGITTFALWRLGSEDRSLWAVWDAPGEPQATQKLSPVPPGQDVDMEGRGEILRIDARPSPGTRQITFDAASGLITGERFTILPEPYRVMQYGAQAKQVAISFDDGPDPAYTPKILDILKAEQVPGTFFLIGAQAERYSGLTRRIYREGHEIGNHTFWHPDIANISRNYMRVELNFTERFFASELGVKPIFFRAPYSIDQEPDTADQVRPLETVQDLGYITVGSKLDPSDWQTDPRPTAEEITATVLARLTDVTQPGCTAEPCGNIVLLHDGGGDRSQTVRALPMIIHELRARGYTLVRVSGLLDKTSAEVMPQLGPNERWGARLDSFGFLFYRLFQQALILIFFVGDTLMTLRLLVVGALALYDRLRAPPREAGGEYAPAVALLVPAFNEETVVERTVRAALASTYARLRVIVIDDGSTDATVAVARRAFASEIEAGRVLVLTQANAGKAEALNRGLAQVEEEIFLGIDADTVIDPAAVTTLVAHFADARVAAVAGNTRVGNRVNLWTRWQALEYITSQNFERRALNVLNAVSVVPGAIGAWRTSAVRDAGGFHPDTVAEDADLTMSLLERGLRVNYDDRALAYTEAPTSAGALMRQRFRWSFGILQAVWKHRGAFARRGVLGWIALPNIVIFQILLPLAAPFIDLMFFAAGFAYLVDRLFHPDSADPTNFLRLAVFFAVFLMVDLLASLLAFTLERRQGTVHRDFWLLAHVWLQRFAYRQLFSVVLFKTVKRAIDGRQFSWDKLERTASALSHGRPA